MLTTGANNMLAADGRTPDGVEAMAENGNLGLTGHVRTLAGSAERGTRPIVDYADPGFELRRPLRSVETAARNHIDRLMGTGRHRQAAQRLWPAYRAARE
jgi:hypothetical protein